MVPGAQPYSYVNAEALTVSPVVQQMLCGIFITQLLHIVVLIWTQGWMRLRLSNRVSRHADKRHFQRKNTGRWHSGIYKLNAARWAFAGMMTGSWRYVYTGEYESHCNSDSSQQSSNLDVASSYKCVCCTATPVSHCKQKRVRAAQILLAQYQGWHVLLD